MPVDTLKQRIDAMHTAQLSLDAPPPATRVSATNVFHRSKRAALTALTALTPPWAAHPVPAIGIAVAEIAETPTDAQRRRPSGTQRQAIAERWVRWRRGWDSNPRYACTHNGFRDRPDRPLWHLSGAPLIGGRFCRGNSAVGGADIPLFSPESGVSGVDLGGFLRIFRPPPAGHSGPPCSFVLSGILGMGPANPPICCGGGW
jgi:hypothetical protein